MSAQFLHNNLVKFCCARLNIFKLCILKTLILKGLNRYDLPIALCPLKEPYGSIFVLNKGFVTFLFTFRWRIGVNYHYLSFHVINY